MPSDPTTKDLIRVARDDAAYSQTPKLRLKHHVTALADLLEEVEEERGRIRILAAHWRATEGKMLQAGKSHTAAYADGVADAYEDVFRDSPGQGPNMGPDMPDSPEPSDPESDRIIAPLNLAGDPEPEEEPYMLGPLNADLLAEDDPWDKLQAYDDSPWKCALLDLRKRAQEDGDDQDILHSQVTILWNRLTTLEQHADRGNEAERDINRRLGDLEARLGRMGLRRDQYERIQTVEGKVGALESDVRGALRERVDRLEKRLNALEFPAFGEDSTP